MINDTNYKMNWGGGPVWSVEKSTLIHSVLNLTLRVLEKCSHVRALGDN